MAEVKVLVQRTAPVCALTLRSACVPKYEFVETNTEPLPAVTGFNATALSIVTVHAWANATGSTVTSTYPV